MAVSKPKRKAVAAVPRPGQEAAVSGSALEAPADSLFRALFDNLPNPAYIWRQAGDDFILIGSNIAAANLSFSDVRQLIGRRAGELQADGTHDLVGELRRCLASGAVIRREVEHRYIASGVQRLLAVTIMPVCKTIAVMHTEDITERRRADQALRESERQYRQIVDTANEGIWTTDAEGTTTYVNRRMAEMLGYEPAEMLERQALDFVDADEHQELLAMRERWRTGNKKQFDFRLRHKDGRHVWVSVSAAPILDEQNRYAGTIGMLSDITDRRRVEQALRESEMRMRAFVEANPDMVIRVTRDGRYIDVHAKPEREAFLPRPASAFIGHTVDELFGPEFARQHERYRHAALDTGRLQLWEYVREFNGSLRHMEARFVKSGDDEVVITLRDITDRVALEREVIGSAERERERVGHDLHDGLAQLLTGIKLLLEPLKQKLAIDAPRHADTAERAIALVGQAIADTRELAQGLSPIPKGATFEDALRSLAEHSERLLGLRCVVACSCPPLPLHDSASVHLYRIAQEAITNAARHGKAAEVRVSCGPRGDTLELAIEDDGVGVHSSRAGDDGMGIRIMRYRARGLSGELRVGERPGGGTVVTLSCPLGAIMDRPENAHCCGGAQGSAAPKAAR